MPKNFILKNEFKIINNYTKANHTDDIPINEFVKIMANLFKVSEYTMKYRLITLNIINY